MVRRKKSAEGQERQIFASVIRNGITRKINYVNIQFIVVEKSSIASSYRRREDKSFRDLVCFFLFLIYCKVLQIGVKNLKQRSSMINFYPKCRTKYV